MDSISIPALEILFALFLTILPEGTRSFSIQIDVDESPIVWTLQDDGSWNGQSEDGLISFGDWKKDGMNVISESSTGVDSIDLSPWMNQVDGGFLIDGSAVMISKVEDSGTWLFYTPRGIFEKLVRIEVK